MAWAWMILIKSEFSENVAQNDDASQWLSISNDLLTVSSPMGSFATKLYFREHPKK